jgi:hypothetical protein
MPVDRSPSIRGRTHSGAEAPKPLFEQRRSVGPGHRKNSTCCPPRVGSQLQLLQQFRILYLHPKISSSPSVVRKRPNSHSTSCTKCRSTEHQIEAKCSTCPSQIHSLVSRNTKSEQAIMSMDKASSRDQFLVSKNTKSDQAIIGIEPLPPKFPMSLTPTHTCLTPTQQEHSDMDVDDPQEHSDEFDDGGWGALQARMTPATKTLRTMVQLHPVKRTIPKSLYVDLVLHDPGVISYSKATLRRAKTS